MSFGIERKTSQSLPLNGIQEQQLNSFSFKNFLEVNKIALDPLISPSEMQLLEEFYRLRQQVLKGKLNPFEVAKRFETMVREIYPQEEEEEKFYQRMGKPLSLITKLTSNQ